MTVALKEMTTELQTAARSPMAKAGADFEQIAASVSASLERLERATASIVRAGNAWFEELASASPVVGEGTIDAAIESLRSQEERLAETVVPTIAEGQKGLKQSFQVPRQLRAKSHRLSTRIIEVHAQAVEALRDLRWKFLALRASIEGPGDHPVLDSVEELESYLDRAL